MKPSFPRHVSSLIIIAAAALLASCAALKKVVKKPTISYASMSLRRVTFNDVSVDLVFNVDNPNVFAIPLKRYRYTFNVGDHTVFDGDREAVVEIPAQGRGQLTVPVNVRYGDVIEAVRLLRDSEKWPYSVAGSVTIDAGPLAGITVPFSHRDTIPRPLPPVIGVERLNVRSLGFTSIELDVVLSLRNPGRIPYTLTSFVGSIELNERRFVSIDRLQDAVNLSANGSQSITIPVRLSASELARGLQNIITQGEARYRLVGDAGLNAQALGDLPLKLDQSGNVRLFK